MFEEIAGKLKDVENSVRLHARVVVVTMRITECFPSQLAQPSPQVLSLILSLRLSLSILTTSELASQLLLLPLQDAELALRMYVKRRLPGDGRWSVCKALEALEGNVGVDYRWTIRRVM
jgi:hypothetical protein